MSPVVVALLAVVHMAVGIAVTRWAARQLAMYPRTAGGHILLGLVSHLWPLTLLVVASVWVTGLFEHRLRDGGES